MNADNNVILIPRVHNFAQTCHQVITCLYLYLYLLVFQKCFLALFSKVLAPWKLLTCIPLYVELHAVKLCMPVINVYNVIVCITPQVAYLVS